jgi:acetyl-CoA carboxylase biotin carboxyl carrier protein
MTQPMDQPTPPGADPAVRADLAAPVDTDLPAVLGAVLAGACDLLVSATTQPSALRVTAGPVAVELSWPSPAAPAAGGPAQAPAAPVAVAAPGHEHGLPRLVSLPRAEPAAAVDPGGAGAEPAAGRDLAHQVCAPTVGVFYAAPEPGAAPFVTVGDVIRPDQQLGIVEAMKMMIPVEAKLAGRVTAVLCADAAEVEFGEPLFVIDAG